MKIAVLILGLLLGIVMLAQTTLVAGLSGMANDTATAGAGAIGMLVAVMWLVAIALVFAIPLISAIMFVLAGLLAFAAGASSTYGDITIWGVVSLVLGLMSFFAWRTKRKEDREKLTEKLERQRMNEQMALMAKHVTGQQQSTGGPPMP